MATCFMYLPFIMFKLLGYRFTLWVTGSSTPCISCFKPVFLEIDSGAPVFKDESGSKAYWLKREYIHRGVLAGVVNPDTLRSRLLSLEKIWLLRESELFQNSTPDLQDLRQFSIEAAREEEEVISGLLDGLINRKEWSMPSNNRFSRYWKRKNEKLERIENCV